MVTPVESAAHHAARVATVSAASSASTSSPLGTIALFLACIVLFGCCCVCALLQVRAYQRRRHEEERQPLIEPQYDPYGSPAGGSRGRGADMAAIGTPARDFVRLSPPPAAHRRCAWMSTAAGAWRAARRTNASRCARAGTSCSAAHAPTLCTRARFVANTFRASRHGPTRRAERMGTRRRMWVASSYARAHTIGTSESV